jgi:hypothetical protein
MFLGNIAALRRADGVVIGGAAERTAFLLQRELTTGCRLSRVPNRLLPNRGRTSRRAQRFPARAAPGFDRIHLERPG